MTLYHEHPARILRYSVKNIWLLIFPLIRGIRHIRLSPDWFYHWIKGAWFDILILGLIVVFGFVRWYFSRIAVTGSSVIHMDGIIFRVRKEIPFSRISSTSVMQPFYLAPFNAVYLRCDTSGGFLRTADMKVMISDNLCRRIMEKAPDVDENSKLNGIPRPTALSVIMFSFFFSSGLSGAVYMGLFFYKGGDIARNIIGAYFSRIAEQTSRFTDRLLLKIPDAAVGVGAAFLGMWLISFIVNLLRYARFSVTCDDKCLITSYGAVNHREHRITSSHINYTDLRQNLIMKLAGAVAVHISCAGYGYERRSQPVLLPVRREKDMGSELEAIGVFSGIRNEFRPKWTGFWQYVWMPVIIAASLMPLHFAVSRLLPELSDLTLFAAVMFEVPSVWMIAVKTAAFFTSGISLYDDKIMLRYSWLNGFHTIVAERKKIVKVELMQTVFQKIGGRCTVGIWFEGEDSRCCRVKALATEDVRSLEALLGYRK